MSGIWLQVILANHKSQKMENIVQVMPIFRIDAPSAEDLDAFHRDGFVAYPAVFSDEGLKSFVDEIHSRVQVTDYFNDNKGKPDEHGVNVRPWNNKGPWSDQLFDAPLVTALLRAIIGENFQFCHSTMHIKMRGGKGVHAHMDHHHWFHNNPINIAERDNWYVQMLYYPNGFKGGDASLAVIPGSHRIVPVPGKQTQYDTLEEMLEGVGSEQAGRELKVKHFELPPGSMVCLNARTYHAVTPKPLDSPQEYRIFCNYIFKEAGPPHRHTQVIPPDWLEDVSPERQKLFDREPYTEVCWE